MMINFKHPYQTFPDWQFWNRSIAGVPLDAVDPVVTSSFQIRPEDRVATAGSCFAQHIARYLSNAGFNYFVAEPGHPTIPLQLQREFGFGVFSARFGNIYTTRQLLQMLLRAYGEFKPDDDVWISPDGRHFDPFRPTINPEGYPTLREFREDRRQHFAAIRRMFEQLDVFVFTLGLTECWASLSDGAVYPVCPGTAAGTFSPERHAFLNLTVDDVARDLNLFIEHLMNINPRARMILTVSPVPLVATAEAQHVLVATTLSKSVLRVAADMITRKYAHIDYFPSFELITGAFNRGQYFAEDLRSVTESGVAHVMRLFLKHYANSQTSSGNGPRVTAKPPDITQPVADVLQVMCDEEVLNNSGQ